jgi:molecular chaperone HscA
VLADDENRFLLPSVVQYRADGSTVVGDAAREAAAEDSVNTISSVKRLMGRGAKECRDSAYTPYNIVECPSGVALRTVAGDKTPVEVSSEILKVLKKRAEERLGGELVGAVITVPA